MNVSTHKQIALKIYQQYNMHFEKLDKKSFIYGNIKPDITIGLRRKSHKMKESLDFIVKRINKLTSTRYTSVKKFSIDLGIINHFLADFFCSVHFFEETKEYNNIILHILYENKLAKRFNKIKDNISLYNSQNEINELSSDNLSEAILNLANTYSKIIPSIDNDIQYILKVTSLISLYIINNSYYLNVILNNINDDIVLNKYLYLHLK